jgi:hypothetical protein
VKDEKSVNIECGMAEFETCGMAYDDAVLGRVHHFAVKLTDIQVTSLVNQRINKILLRDSRRGLWFERHVSKIECDGGVWIFAWSDDK